ncbi:MAG: N-6 DNA methylase [Bacteroidia bacterium]|nr:N-6 DNA methylase [Bacteroidia bacterium]
MNLALNFELSIEDNLLKRFEEIHNYIYANDGLSTQQTLEEIIKILFIKIFDENNKVNQFQISSDELSHLKQNNTATNFVRRITNLIEETKREFKDVFDADEKIRLSNISLGFTINKLQTISLSGSSSDAKGLAFQKFLAHQEKDGRGQFFTPEPVINFCVEIIQPKPNEIIIDPACGSGGFLISSLNYLLKNNSKTKAETYISKNLVGLDINKSIARIAKMKLLLEANGQANIFCTNSLDDIDEIKLTISEALNQKSFEGFDIVLTNPPFGTVGKITNTKILSRYDLGYKWTGADDKYYKTKTLSNGLAAEILFIERCLQLLKEGGRLGIVLPNGHFENPSLEYLRFYIKQKANVLAIVNLPQETFIPYGTGVKTSLLFLEKETANSKTKYPIFFSKIKKPGYHGNKNGTPVYKKDKYGMTLKGKNGIPIIDEDFSTVIEDYKAFQKKPIIETENSFSINFNELNGRFDYDFYSPDNRKMLTVLESKNAKRLCEIAEIIKVKSKKLNQSDKTVEYVELSDINTHSFEIINTTNYLVHELPSRASYELKTGDIITAVAGNSVGTAKHATALVTEEFDGCICTNGFRVLRNFKINPYYLLYFLKSESFLKQMYMYRTGAAIPNVSDYDLANILINLPDEKTIKQIGDKVKKAFELRQESKKQLESISLERHLYE